MTSKHPEGGNVETFTFRPRRRQVFSQQEVSYYWSVQQVELQQGHSSSSSTQSDLNSDRKHIEFNTRTAVTGKSSRHQNTPVAQTHFGGAFPTMHPCTSGIHRLLPSPRSSPS